MTARAEMNGRDIEFDEANKVWIDSETKEPLGSDYGSDLLVSTVKLNDEINLFEKVVLQAKAGQDITISNDALLEHIKLFRKYLPPLAERTPVSLRREARKVRAVQMLARQAKDLNFIPAGNEGALRNALEAISKVDEWIDDIGENLAGLHLAATGRAPETEAKPPEYSEKDYACIGEDVLPYLYKRCEKVNDALIVGAIQEIQSLRDIAEAKGPRVEALEALLRRHLDGDCRCSIPAMCGLCLETDNALRHQGRGGVG